jgi:hypothetical protein
LRRPDHALYWPVYQRRLSPRDARLLASHGGRSHSHANGHARGISQYAGIGNASFRPASASQQHWKGCPRAQNVCQFTPERSHGRMKPSFARRRQAGRGLREGAATFEGESTRCEACRPRGDWGAQRSEAHALANGAGRPRLVGGAAW